LYELKKAERLLWSYKTEFFEIFENTKNKVRRNSPRTIQRSTIHRAQFTAHNLPRTLHRGTIHHGTNHRSIVHRAQFTAQNSPRIIHHEKIKIPLNELLILLD
jgi:hypothetical protein